MVMLPRINKEKSLGQIESHLYDFAVEGLRTLVMC